MNKVLFVTTMTLAAVFSSGAHATAACSGNGTAVAVPTGAFVLKAFSAKCSANVLSNYSQSNTAFGVVAGSQKGKNVFGGGTEGGGIVQKAECPATGCTTGEVSDAASTAAMGQASS
ncbi:MAG: hypothetical protein AW10_02845 [Candidatus Accumulibacter appositus]|uniref:Uncharacterized protein n=1 Tax=Candidatus Accumulibacter appositus TaxID=1454003 RepID=A0A011NTL2_9PROT|nr:hypothetical protein [Accumulibacter sp.]EXI78691.1 MAG: hypothetical protein AW10_02845 [Candidatus Accumulibacter appositus]HRF03350.1 hypothetical protein [Accumulibacter sp.]